LRGFIIHSPKFILKKIISKTLHPRVFGRGEQRNGFHLLKFEPYISIHSHFLLLAIIGRYFSQFPVNGHYLEVFHPNFLLFLIKSERSNTSVDKYQDLASTTDSPDAG
jgi:hypothetical protein